MAVKIYKPNTPGTREKIQLDFSELSKARPEKKLTQFHPRAVGRNNQGRITIHHRGGGHKRLYRQIDFKRNKVDVTGQVSRIEYDPNRNVNIALIVYEDGEKRYILQPETLVPGSRISAGPNAPIQVGNALPLRNIPIGTEVHNLELYPNRGGQLIRSAGTSGRLIGKDNGFAIIRLPSKEVRLVAESCHGTIGRLSNSDILLTSLGKAGRNRWIGRRPTVRGVVKNPCDHPHGGGEGRSPIGRARPVTPWGKPALGMKTRKRTKQSNVYILKQRK